ncbi:protein penguin [Aricia agestis]|uniref:protein penguin n=1 Tax=Aricia agestis TaxID=91739 RepID=UPI001C201E57|nr:protein penguin [Aricia agestis]
MELTKRKSSENESSTHKKKKKVQFATPNNAENGKKSAGDAKPKDKKFKFNKPDSGKNFQAKGAKKFTKPGKPSFKTDKKPKKDGPTEKPKWSEMKKEKKNLRKERRIAKITPEVYEVSHKAKLLAAQIPRQTLKLDFRTNCCKELHALIKGKYKAIALTHDLSRVIQVLLKHGPPDLKIEVIEELLDMMVQMMQLKYAHHTVRRSLKYGTDNVRHQIIKMFFGHIVSLASHTISAPILDYAFKEFATKKEKLHMQQEFYGDMYKNTKDEKIKTLSDAYKDCPEMKSAILQSCKANIQRILDKNLHDAELFQLVLYDYIRECSAEDRAELITTLSPLIVPLSNSLAGVNAACMCVWQGTNKDKKTIMKVVKKHVVPLSQHKTGYRLLLAIFDSVDDTVLVKKAIVSVLVNNLKEVLQTKDHCGKMVLHWLVKPKDPSAFHPSLTSFLEEGAKNGTSKKTSELRVSELREAIIPALLKDIQANPEFWLENKVTMLLTVAILSIETSEEIVTALAKVICKPDWTVETNGKKILAIEDAGIHMCLKKFAVMDKTSSVSLGEKICEIEDDTLQQWIKTNRGCFFLVKLIENNNEDVVKKLKTKIKPASNILKQQTSEGAKLLLQLVKK